MSVHIGVPGTCVATGFTDPGKSPQHMTSDEVSAHDAEVLPAY